MNTIEYCLVLVRHGHSDWNLSNRFTGWSDIALTEVGLEEAKNCGKNLASQEFEFDEVHISVLERTRQTAEQLLSAAEHREIPYHRSWRLNERHYGCLQGMNKQEIFTAWGEQQSYCWWRGYNEPPPPLDDNDLRHPRFDECYADIDASLLPSSESLEQCMQRLIPYWQEVIVPSIQSGQRLLIVSHGNTLRSLRMHVENIDPEEIQHIEIPSAVPLVYRFNSDMELLGFEWLEGDQLSPA